MGKKSVLLILVLALVGLLVVAGILYKDLGEEMAPDQLAVQTQPTTEAPTCLLLFFRQPSFSVK